MRGKRAKLIRSEALAVWGPSPHPKRPGFNPFGRLYRAMKRAWTRKQVQA